MKVKAEVGRGERDEGGGGGGGFIIIIMGGGEFGRAQSIQAAVVGTLQCV